VWPAKALLPRFHLALANGVLDDADERELLELLQSTLGGNPVAQGQASMSTDLPLTAPPPLISFPGRSFCFTGKFQSGSRVWCETQVAERGGSISAVTRDLSYLVIGDVGSRDWIHSTHGRKIEKAVEYAGRGMPIAIVCEERWHQSL
jgi:NAD-dependent DNA ligase